MGRSFKDKFIIIIAEYLILFFMWLIFLTCKKKYIGQTIPKEPCVVLFWHGKLAMMPFVFKIWWKNKAAKVIISDHKDGEIITRIISHFGIGSVRGSSSKNAARALATAFKEIKNGTDIAITPDGPRGPRHSISDGCVIIPQKTNSKIVILDYNASKFWQFKSWDKMILPKPFSTIYYKISEPFSIENLDLQTAKDLLYQRLIKSF
nr:lysophospholipid acyltransferase family protein [Campylobacter sp.]